MDPLDMAISQQRANRPDKFKKRPSCLCVVDVEAAQKAARDATRDIMHSSGGGNGRSMTTHRRPHAAAEGMGKASLLGEKRKYSNVRNDEAMTTMNGAATASKGRGSSGEFISSYLKLQV